MKRLALALVGVAFATLAHAQQVTTSNLVGTETFNGAASLGGSGITVPGYVLRGGCGYTAVGAGTTVNTTVPNTSCKVIATGAITTWNITLPTTPFDGEMVQVTCPGGAATVAMSATAPSGVTIVGTAFTACTAGGAATAEWLYSTSANTWNRIQ